MCRHFTAVNRVYLAHTLLDKRVPGFAQHGLTPGGSRNILSVPGQTRVVDDALRSEPSEKSFRQQPDNVIPLDEMALAIEEKTAIKVSVPSDAHICLLGNHPISGS